ncbi:MAG: hypothetical protein ACM3WQ_03410 [Chloroflexota bacterium]
MKTWLLYTVVAILLALFFFAGIHVYLESKANSDVPNIFVGVDAAYDNMTSLKARVDEVKDYTNFFIIGSYGITFNETKVNNMCQYLYDSGLSFAVFAHTNRDSNDPYQLNQSAWSGYARQTWGVRFVGLYCYDEPGGHQVDHDPYFSVVKQADNYSDAADKFVVKIRDDALLDFIPTGSMLMTSDYALYDFDYKAGYDVIFAELAWNHSRPINIALARGAATAHSKDWGVMLTYTYTLPPYLESGQQMYDDLVLAYQNGAKYFVVFDYAKDPNTNVTYGILQPEHLQTIQRFWNYVKHNPQPAEYGDRMAYVLPKDYAYGFRGPTDSIWGLWGPDKFSSKIWSDVTSLVSQYGNRLDIVYEDSLQIHAYNYTRLIFWNGTDLGI